jgi:hypothetical protein
MPVAEVCSSIREAVVAQCDPYQFSEPWEFLPVHDDVRYLPADPARLLTALREMYSEDALIEWGVAERVEDGSLAAVCDGVERHPGCRTTDCAGDPDSCRRSR